MKSTLRQLRSLENELHRLKQEIVDEGELSGHRQVELLRDAIYGGSAEKEKLAALHAAGRIHPFLWRLFQLEVAGPCYATSQNDCRGCTTGCTHPAAHKERP